MTYHLKAIRCGKAPIASPEVSKLPAMPSPLANGPASGLMEKLAALRVLQPPSEQNFPFYPSPTATIRAKPSLLPWSYSPH